MSLPTRPTDVLVSAGVRLRAAREALGLPQQELARACGTEPQRWSNWENGRHLPDPIVLVRAAQLFGISLDWVFAGDPRNLPGGLMARLSTLRPDLMGSAPPAPAHNA